MAEDFPGARPFDAPPFSLDHDPERDQWTLTIHDHGNHLSAVLPASIVDQLADRITSQRLQADNGLQFQVTAVVYEMMGAEGAAFIRKPVRHDPTETIQSLAMRAFGLVTPYHRHHPGDRLEVQVIPESIPDATGGKGLLDF